MLNEIASRKQKLGLSTRRLARQLEVSPALLSLVLNEKRGISGDLKGRIRRWLNTPMADGGYNHPNTVYKEFMAERASFVSAETLRYYREKLEPFILWCEKHDLADITQIDRGTIGEFLAYVRKGRRKYGNTPLSNGAIKLHHQTLKTLFNYTGQTRSVNSEWSNPVKAIKVKRGDATRVEYSDHELSSVMEIIGRNRDQVLRLRNLAIVTVLLNSALRASELLSMQTSDVSENGRLTANGKGGKRRTVTIGQSGVDAVNAYLNSRNNWNGHLWKTRTGAVLTRAGLRQVMNHIKDQAQSTFVNGLYAHRFRHTAITRLLRAEVPLRSVQRYAGHTDPQTTLRYAQAIDVDEAIAAVESLAY